MSISTLISIVRTSPSDAARREAIHQLEQEYKKLIERNKRKRKSYPHV